MAWVFNPFTGKLDQAGSGGGGGATTDASLLTSGTLADARLSSNVSLDNQNNNFTAGQTIASGTLTASAPALNITQTWNNASVVFKAATINATDTASNGSSLLMDFQVGGATVASVLKTGRIIATSVRTSTSNGLDIGTSGGSAASIAYSGCFFRAPLQVRNAADQNATLNSDAPEILAQRNGTNAQLFRIYNTFTDASNFERGFMRWNSNVLEIGTEAGGTGTARSASITSAGGITLSATNLGINFRNNSTTIMQIGSRVTISGSVLQINNPATPASASATGSTGMIQWDADFIYVCTATNTWKRAALSTW
jgi:hypothetical protein